jgi:hypothetical protein
LTAPHKLSRASPSEKVQAVHRNWPQRRRRSGTLRDTIQTKSSDLGHFFILDIEGRWEERSRHAHHNPESVVTSYVIDQVGRRASSLSLLEHDLLQNQINSLLGRPINLSEHNIRLLWARVYVHARPQDVVHLLDMRRQQVSAKHADEEMRLRIDRITSFRNALREDPTLALAQMLLETPSAVSPETLNIMELIATRIAAYAPGTEFVAIAQVLRDFITDLKPDAKQFIVDRLCAVLVEFGGAASVDQIRARTQPLDAQSVPRDRVQGYGDV